MRIETVVTAEARDSRGKNEARRVRVSGRIPAVIYGAFQDPRAVSLNPKDILRIIRSKTGHNSIFDVEVAGGEKTPVIVADEQYHPVKGTLMHIDLKRIDLTRKLRVSIPVHVTGEAKGVKQQGGVLDIVTKSVEIECIPDDIPDRFDVDVAELMIGMNIRVSQLPVKEGVRILTSPEVVIAHVVGIKEEVVATPDVAAATTGEPEIAKKGKKDEAAPAAAPAEKGKKK
ncbi:MAG TPA: 50S ribosomal protein L25 [Bryobacteraceae bacterium]|nr:50S ribosomal protein L25 [Bryobacteraceae bacterium]